MSLDSRCCSRGRHNRRQRNERLYEDPVVGDPVLTFQIGNVRLAVLLQFHHLFGLLHPLYVFVRRDSHPLTHTHTHTPADRLVTFPFFFFLFCNRPLMFFVKGLRGQRTAAWIKNRPVSYFPLSELPTRSGVSSVEPFPITPRLYSNLH